jgi:hypothetical protein
MALVASLFATALLAGLGLSLVLLGSAETTLAAHDVRAQAAAHAAQAALSLAQSELRMRESWAGVLAAGASADACAEPGRFTDASLQPTAPWDGSGLDLHALTARRQAASDALVPAGVTGPLWRLFEYGPISRLIPSDARRHPYYVVVWAADGRGGMVLLHSAAIGPAGVTADVDASVARGAGGTSLVRLAIRAQP